MNNRKTILLIFHLNFLKQDRGCSNTVYSFAKILKSFGFSIDFFTSRQFDKFTDIALYNKNNLIDNFYIDGLKVNIETFCNSESKHPNVYKNKFLDMIKNILLKLHVKKYYYYAKNNILLKIKKIFRSHKYYSETYVSNSLLKRFKSLIITKHYDYIFIHYIQWTDLLRYTNIPENTKCIYYMQDTNFMQYFYNNKLIKNKIFRKIFSEELDALNYYQHILCISFDEMLFWSKLLPDIDFIFCPAAVSVNNLSNEIKNIDILFIGHNNIFNTQGICWFLDEVLPLLPNNLNITFCGKFLNGLEQSYLHKIDKYNINKINFADNLNDLYIKTKIAIAPILKGTGLKIKTIEALSYSIPVVSTLLGVDGFPDKFESGCLVSDIPSEFAQNIIKLLSDANYYNEIKNKQTYYYNKYLSYERCVNILNKIFF